MRDETSRRLGKGRALSLAILAVLPFLNGLTGDFTYDDKLIIRDNERIASPRTLGQVFTTQYFGGSLSNAQNYRPLVLVTYALQRWTTGNRPFWFHVVNVLLHAGTTVCLAAWLVMLGFPRGPSCAVAALFAVLTIHVESVTSLVGRAEVLAAFIALLSALLWLQATEGGDVRPWPYAASLLAFLSSVFVKENAVVLPGMVALGELFRGGRPRGPVVAWREASRRVRLAFLGLFVPVLVLFAVRRIVLKGFLISREAGIFDLENPLVGLSPQLRVANAATLLFRYVAKTFVPVGLAADHSANALPLALRLGEVRGWAGLAGLALCAAFALFLFRRRPLASFGAALFFGSILPTANLLFPIGTIYAERLMYLPSAGLLAFAVGLLVPAQREVPHPSTRPWREVLLVAAVLAYAAGTLGRNRVWRDDATLYADMVRKVPTSAKAHYDLAYDALRRGEKAVAEVYLKSATEIFPRYYDSWALLGKIAWDRKRWEEAAADYRKSVQIFPHYENGRWGLAKVLEESGHAAEAEKAFRDGIREFPDSYPLTFHFASFLEAQERLEEADAEWAHAITAGHGAVKARLGRARVLVRLGRPGDEEEAWNEARYALTIDPASADARLFLAERYEQAGKTLAGGAELSRAYRSHPENETLAAELLEYAARHRELRGRARLALPSIGQHIPKPGERLRKALRALDALSTR